MVVESEIITSLYQKQPLPTASTTIPVHPISFKQAAGLIFESLHPPGFSHLYDRLELEFHKSKSIKTLRGKKEEKLNRLLFRTVV
jgi:hypothetical protein